MPQRKGEPLLFSRDEHPRSTSLEALAKLRGVVRADGSVTAGNASGLTTAPARCCWPAGRRCRLTIFSRWPGWSAWRRLAWRRGSWGFGPAPAVRKVLAQTGLTLGQMDVMELNEAFARAGAGGDP
ncbi:hypothetical protein LNO89_02910 [Klebsiella pneumoniae subsp. pneumoniae]|nr:hypothetical protein [Klebsiella pneumoniae subsp. pneumoniae]